MRCFNFLFVMLIFVASSECIASEEYLVIAFCDEAGSVGSGRSDTQSGASSEAVGNCANDVRKGGYDVSPTCCRIVEDNEGAGECLALSVSKSDPYRYGTGRAEREGVARRKSLNSCSADDCATVAALCPTPD